MYKANIASLRIIALMVSTLGLLLLVRWSIDVPLIDIVIPSAKRLGFNTPAMFFAIGTSLYLATLPKSSKRILQTIQFLLASYVACLSIATLVEQIFNVNLGIDFLRVPTAPTVEAPNPGRVAPNTCLAFLFSAIALYFASRPTRSHFQRNTMMVCISAIVLIAFTALVGHALDLGALYRLAKFNSMLPLTAVGLLLVSLGLWFELQDLQDQEDVSVAAFERRITRRSAGILAAVAISTGVAGFSILESGVDKTTSQNLLSTAIADGAALSAALESRLWFSKTMQTRPKLIELLRTSTHEPDKNKTVRVLDEISKGLFSSGVTWVRFLDAHGGVLNEFGTSKDAPSAVHLPLTTEGQIASLVWSNGFFLRTDVPLYAQDELVGKIALEQWLPTFESLITAAQSNGDSTELVICGRSGKDTLCAPSRFHTKARLIPLSERAMSAGENLLPSAPDQPEISRRKDIRGVATVAAYTPLKTFGLGMTLKVDADSFVAPVREHLIELLLITAGFVALGVVLAKLQIQPLLAQVVYEQTRNSVILANSNDAFIGMDAEGRVTDWNAKAESMFHWSEKDAMGQYLAELIVPPAQRHAHNTGVAHFKVSGQGPVLNQQLEVMALRRDGTLLPVELSVTGFHDGRSHIANAFIRDISARKDFEKKLADGERFIRTITDNLPALVGYVDMDERYRFANSSYQTIMGIDPHTVIGKTLSEVFGEVTREALDPYVGQVKRGISAHFERRGTEPDRPAYFATDFIPDISPDGTVQGFFIHSIDTSVQKAIESQLRQSEERLKAVTDNLPVLISYLDVNRCFKFGNATFLTWLGVAPATLNGKFIADVIGEDAYEERRGYIDRGFAGETVYFDITSVALGVRRVLQTVYVPHVLSSGVVDGLYTISSDITPLKDAERELSALARVDQLTDIPNRRQFDERMDEALSRHQRTAQPLALMFLDIDKFKGINDGLGHAAGDEVLRQFASRLKKTVRKTDVVARYAGDEFVIIVDGFKDPRELEVIARKILTALRKPMVVENMSLHVTASIGITKIDSRDRLSQPVVARADEALYIAKKSGRDCFYEWRETSSKGLET